MDLYELKKELLLDNKCKIIDTMDKVSDMLTTTIICTQKYSELCAFYLNLDNTLESINKELLILEKHIDEYESIEEEDSVNV